jgi:hypothetical protein
MTFKEQIELYLSDLPEKWKDKIVQILCLIKEGKQEPDCETVKDCETLTSLSDFTVDGSIVSITYKDEDGVSITRSFDAATIINNTLEDIDPSCLATQTVWDSLTFPERLQLLIDRHCTCCDIIEIPFTNTAIIGCSHISSGTTPPDNDPGFAHYIKFIGQSGQDNVYVEIPIDEDELGFFIPLTGSLNLPGSMSGSYRAILFMMVGGDYPSATLQNSVDADIAGGTMFSGNTPSALSGAFNIANLDHIAFSCENSG